MSPRQYGNIRAIDELILISKIVKWGKGEKRIVATVLTRFVGSLLEKRDEEKLESNASRVGDSLVPQFFCLFRSSIVPKLFV